MEYKEEYLQTYHKELQSELNEASRSRLIQELLSQLFGNDSTAKETLSKMNRGAERLILNIEGGQKEGGQKEGGQKEGGKKFGYADLYYDHVIIELKKDLRKNERQAKQQLEKYLSAEWKLGKLYDFTLIATDGRIWKVYAPNRKSIAERATVGESNTPISLQVTLQESESFVFDGSNFRDFPFFLDRYLFQTVKRPATLESIRRDFGQGSQPLISNLSVMQENFSPYTETSYTESRDRVAVKGGEVKSQKEYPELATCFEEWKKFLGLAYGSFFEGREKEEYQEIFFVHSYLSAFAKILAYSVLNSESFVREKSLHEILNGEAFKRIRNFVEEDFYHWVYLEKENRRYFPILRDVLLRIAYKLRVFDFSDLREDILKGVYQELIDLDTRKALGEYYTPDWLCTRIVESMDLKPEDRILDPSCGSGSFLRSAISYLKKNSKVNAKTLSENLMGIDVHPLAVQIAKTNFVLALQELLAQASDPLQLRIYLADSLLRIESEYLTSDRYTESIRFSIDQQDCSISDRVFKNDLLFEKSIDRIMEIVDQKLNSGVFTRKEFDSFFLQGLQKIQGVQETLREWDYRHFYELYKILRRAKEEDRDDIWAFVLKNLYRPALMKESFDVILGNPPWITFSQIVGREYQNQLKSLAGEYQITISSQANAPGLEVASVFLAHASSHYLKDRGRLALVLPRSFFSGDQHRSFRAGNVLGYRTEEIWDLEKIQPLFKVPSMVLFAQANSKASDQKAQSFPKEKEGGVRGRVFSGFLPYHNSSFQQYQWSIERGEVEESETHYYLSKLGQYTAITPSQVSEVDQANAYRDSFKTGASILPRCFYFVDIVDPKGFSTEYFHPQLKETIEEIQELQKFGTLSIESQEMKDAKAPWNIKLKGNISTDFCFLTALADSLFPFGIRKLKLITLPIEIKKNQVTLLDSQQMFEEGHHSGTKQWFEQAEACWKELKKQKSETVSLYDYLNWLTKLTRQSLDLPYLVLYNASGKNANAGIIYRKDYPLPFIMETTTFGYTTSSLEEAYYLLAFLNSEFANFIIKPFQSKGNFGPRHIVKKILAVPLPKFDTSNPLHLVLVYLAQQCEERARGFSLDYGKPSIGSLRTQVRMALVSELQQIDFILKQLIRS